MTGVRLEIDSAELETMLQAVHALGRLGRPAELLEGMGAVLESSVRRRISEEQEAPDGTPWAEWSDSYAGSRHSGHDLLMNEGELLDSIAFLTDPGSKSVAVGSNLVYAAVHQFGGDELPASNPASNIPQREYLGLSSEDEAELLEIVTAHVQGLLQ
ncbi:MAG: phage virion morphogenesis protein [Pseudomonadota bacterium]